MEENIQTKASISQIRYERLDKYLLFLVTGELGYIGLLGLVFAVLAILSYTTDFSTILFQHRIVFRDISFGLLLLFALALVLNMIGGFASAVLHVASKRQGYPGTGHFLNWLICVIYFLPIIIITLLSFYP